MSKGRSADSENNQAQLPYADLFSPLLSSIHNALAYCYEQCVKKEILIDDDDKKLESYFSEFEKFYKYGVNKHVSKGLSKNDKVKRSIYPRLSKLTLQAFKEAQEITQSGNFQGFVLPSPLSILYQALTVPSEPQTAAYPFVLCRSMLFSFFRAHPDHPELSDKYPHLDSFDEKDVLDSIASLRNHINIQMRWPDKRASGTSLTSRVNFITGHLLALKGIVHLFFFEERDLLDFCHITNHIETYTGKKEKDDERNAPTYRFRLSDSYTELPQHGEIINMIFGIPLPIRGADIIFNEGLKTTSLGGIVGNLSGRPGVGKTSFALSLAALLSPFNTKCIYISLEEQAKDLSKRLITLIPEYAKSLNIFKAPDNHNDPWFLPLKITSNLDVEGLTDVLEKLQNDLDSSKINEIDDTSIPAVCSTYIVIDNINELAEAYIYDFQGYQQLEDLITQCRQMGAFVLLVSGEDVPDKLRLDYLVDLSFNLKQTGIDSEKEKPSRIFQLIKTRHQISRQGSHTFHLSGPVGFRICPQTPSQMDKKEVLRRLLPDKTRSILTLNIHKDDYQSPKPEYSSYLELFPISQILIHGFGSTGKAGFALKILLTPPVARHTDKKAGINAKNKFLKEQVIDTKKTYNFFHHRRRVLVLSFLYPKKYYENLENRISNSIEVSFPKIKKSRLNILSFYPGYLTPEDFINKVVRSLDEATLEGEPFTGVLIDGLHNVFLQFKNLQENHMVWPLLYGILSRFNVTVVSTFTNFSLNTRQIEPALNTSLADQQDSYYHQSIDDRQLIQQGQIPFLHSLVKASDFYLILEEYIVDNKTIAQKERKYLISVKSAVDQKLPDRYLEWDREGLYIKGDYYTENIAE